MTDSVTERPPEQEIEPDPERAADELSRSLADADELFRTKTELVSTASLAADLAPPMPEKIGPYLILRELGSGGMGTVFLAEQIEPVARRVAIKVMRSRYLDQEGSIRFETERQAMARLQHPNVAQIFEAGTTDEGQPYFAMELVDGMPVTKYCDRQRLTVGQRLDLFCDVCAGVHHAHQKGIIHRDLKPSNILIAEVGGKPVPKIIDFGIAKTFGQGPSAVQVTGDRLIGTPAYLSPEAAQMTGSQDLDTRTDVYALGILLYELLVGRRPFDDDSSTLYQVLQRIATEEPNGPSTSWSGLDLEVQEVIASQRHVDRSALRSRLRGDLDWIVLKAIAKDRQERYDSAAALADDIGRHLRHEPVVASPPSTVYRLRKFVRRRAGTVIAGLAVLLALAAGIVARTIEADRANREKAAAIAARQETEQALREAEQARAEAAEVSKFMIGLFRVNDPTEGRGNSVTARELLDAAAVEVRTGIEDQPVAKARFMQTISDVYRTLGLPEEALALAEEGLALRRKHLPADHIDLAESLNGVATMRALLGRFQSAEPLLREALAIRQKVLDPDDLKISGSLNNLGNLLIDLDRAAEAEPLLLQAIEIAEKHDGPSTADQLVAYNNLGLYYSDTNRPAEALPLIAKFLELLRERHGPTHPYNAYSLENMALIQIKLDDFEGAHASVDEAEELLLQIFEDPEHVELAYCYGVRAQILAKEGRKDEAVAWFRRALPIQKLGLPVDHPELVTTVDGLRALGVEVDA